MPTATYDSKNAAKAVRSAMQFAPAKCKLNVYRQINGATPAFVCYKAGSSGKGLRSVGFFGSVN
ncbi:hypothetical protein ATY27_11270 [Rheinheimera sp. F8]|nr:hypothetical protein ATY27_05675 [Rheinheimera sp. F8]ALZ76280.1 hypothetical protein ATY27_11270 [Rheinheimera sp. F8]